MATDFFEATRLYENWLREMTDVQEKALDRKHDEMREGPFPLLRATFYRWVELWEQKCPELHARDQDVVLAVGDLHVENFGMWRDSRRRLVWGINDFDEACELPFTSDLVRLATSVVLAAEARKIPVTVQEICPLLLEGYRRGLAAGGGPIFVESDSHTELKKLIAQVKSPADFWKKKLDEEDNPEVPANELPRRLEEIFRASLPRDAEPQYRRQRKPGGLGSLGRRRYTAVLGEGRTREAREAKALVPSTFYWWEERPEMPSQTGTLLQRAIRSPDPHLQVHDKWLVRRIAPDAVKIELPNSPEDQRLALAPQLLGLMGFETANIHLGSLAPEKLLRSLSQLSRQPGSKWLEKATERMTKATRTDHRAWLQQI